MSGEFFVSSAHHHYAFSIRSLIGYITDDHFGRRRDRLTIRQMTAQFQQTSISPTSQSSYSPSPSPNPPHQSAPAPSSAPNFLHPNSNQWQTTSDFLPPPPAPPILRSGGIPVSHSAVVSPRRVTRSQAGAGAGGGTPKGDIGDKERNPYRKGTRREGGGVV